jgi:hypothetical protein
VESDSRYVAWRKTEVQSGIEQYSTLLALCLVGHASNYRGK